MNRFQTLLPSFNSRRYTQDLPYPIDAVAAVSDFDQRFHEGACGRDLHSSTFQLNLSRI
jgi:hypothetical protein